MEFVKEQVKYFVVIDKWFPSSRKCSTLGCSFKNDALDFSVRELACPQCGELHNRDVNADINIRNEAIRMVTA